MSKIDELIKLREQKEDYLKKIIEPVFCEIQNELGDCDFSITLKSFFYKNDKTAILKKDLEVKISFNLNE